MGTYAASSRRRVSPPGGRPPYRPVKRRGRPGPCRASPPSLCAPRRPERHDPAKPAQRCGRRSRFRAVRRAARHGTGTSPGIRRHQRISHSLRNRRRERPAGNLGAESRPSGNSKRRTDESKGRDLPKVECWIQRRSVLFRLQAGGSRLRRKSSAGQIGPGRRQRRTGNHDRDFRRRTPSHCRPATGPGARPEGK
ncbi:predicted protein [Streptomyces lividans TK24]|nr:predicted protein [Streptomyces lividans TK24]